MNTTTIKYRDSDGNYQSVVSYVIIPMKQTTGDSITETMSLNAITTELNKKYVKPNSGIPISDLLVGSGTLRYLREDGTWQLPTDTVSVIDITSNTTSSCSITGSANSGRNEIIIYNNNTVNDLTITIPNTYKTSTGSAIQLTCLAGGYCEVNYLNINGTIYARGV